MKKITKETIKFKLRELKAKIFGIEKTIDYATSYQETKEVINALREMQETIKGTKAMASYELDRSFMPYGSPLSSEKIKYMKINKKAA